MSEAGTRFALFPTPLGACGIAWSGETVVATHLPDASDALTVARLSARASGAIQGEPPPAIRHAMDAMAALLRGEKTDLAFIACDLSRIEPFAARVYAATRAIPPGETTTYGAIAAQLGDRALAQQVGQALGRNPFPIIVPCHRVMGANGRLTGFSANGGVATKLAMLAIEGARLGEAPGLFGDLPLAAKRRR
ncbi:methylated-DNA--[protein]-cysteine S-methyltransferase [Leptolyngbya sp. 15MV]|nr:methylated-DNA--[protein]-cysteine S-methyltransferase [Leptolyngbya sp. 15MV]